MISAVNGRKCEVPIDNRAARLAELLVDQIDGISPDELHRLMTLLGEFDVKPGRALNGVQIHRALAHIGFLYVAAIKELIEKKGF